MRLSRIVRKIAKPLKLFFLTSQIFCSFFEITQSVSQSENSVACQKSFLTKISPGDELLSVKRTIK